MKAVVLAAGEGTRLRPLTHTRPKPMLPIGDRPLLEHVLEAVRGAGVSEFVFVVGYERERIQNHFGDGDDWDVDIEYAVQEKQLGTGHALLQAEDHVSGDFLALNGDRIVDPETITSVVEELQSTGGPVMAVTRVDTPSNYGVVEFDGQQVSAIVEKPPAHTVTTDYINAGVYGLDESVFEDLRLAETDGELAITAALRDYAGDLRAVPFDGLWLDVSNHWDLLSVNSRMLDRTGTRVPASAVVHEQAAVVDDVAFGEDVHVHPNATVLPGTALSDNVEVGSGAVVANSVVLADSTIGDGAVVRDCVVGENVAVGPNATVEGGETDVVVGDEVHEGVRLGGVVGDHSRLGGTVTLAPGTVVGNDSDVESGSTVDGRIENGATVRRG